MKSAVTISLVEEAKGGPFIFWHNLKDACETASALGFDAIEIFPPSAEALDHSLEIVRNHKLEIAAVGTGAGWVKHKLRLTDPDASIREKAIGFIGRIIRQAAKSDSAVIVGSMQGRWGDEIEREQAIDWLAIGLNQLSQEASAVKVKVFFEALNRYETNLFNRQADAAKFLKNLGLANVQLLCDLFHMNIEEQNIGDTLRGIGELVGHVHFADSNRHAIGFGHINMAEVRDALRAINYTGYISAECLPLPDSNTAAKQTMQSFRQWFRS